MTARAPERTVQGTRELGGVAHERAAVGKPGVDERALDGADAAVHHVAGGDAVRARTRVGEGDLGDARGGGALVERAGRVGIRGEEPAVTVGGVLAETDVAGDVELREERAEFAHGKDDGAGGVVCGRAALVLECNGAIGRVYAVRSGIEGGGEDVP